MGQTQTKIAESGQSEEKKFFSGAKAIIQSLVDQGVDTIFGYP